MRQLGMQFHLLLHVFINLIITTGLHPQQQSHKRFSQHLEAVSRGSSRNRILVVRLRSLHSISRHFRTARSIRRKLSKWTSHEPGLWFKGLK